MHREPRVLEADVQVAEWLDCRARITSKELAQLHTVKYGILRSACTTSQKISALYAFRQVHEQLSKSSQKNGDKNAVAILKSTRQLGCVFSGFGVAEVFIDLTEELHHIEANPMCSIHQSRVASRQHSRPKTVAWSNLPR